MLILTTQHHAHLDDHLAGEFIDALGAICAYLIADADRAECRHLMISEPGRPLQTVATVWTIDNIVTMQVPSECETIETAARQIGFTATADDRTPSQ